MEINESFGDTGVDSTLKAYDNWLYSVANEFAGGDWHRANDLAQEGRIAMWRALQTWDPNKGALPSWLTEAAKLRMKDVAFGSGQPTGHEPMRGRKPADETSLEAKLDREDEADVDWLKIDALNDVELAYHHGEIAAAMATLTPIQRQYVFLRFWGGMDPSSRAPQMQEYVRQFPVLKKRWLWTGNHKQQGAKQKLAEALVHLIDD